MLLAVVVCIGVFETIWLLFGRLFRAESDSLIDPLTGLYNRRGWERRVGEEWRRLQRQPAAAVIFMMDLDDLKGINDREGHAAGDAALSWAAKVIMSITRQHDVATRLGGDEFGLLVSLTDERDANGIEQRLVEGFREKGLSVSIGRALVADGVGLSEAMESADREMYVHKEISYRGRSVSAKQISNRQRELRGNRASQIRTPQGREDARDELEMRASAPSESHEST